MEIYFKITNEELEKIKDIKDLILYHKSLSPIGYFNTTYFDKECTKQQCHSARRSFYDLLDICKTYFPKTTEEELAHFLVNEQNISCFYCRDIQKVVFYFAMKSLVNFNRCGDKYNVNYKGKDQICYVDIVKMGENYKQIQTS